MTLQFLQNARVNVDESGAIAISTTTPITVTITEPLEVEGAVNATPVQSSGASVQLTATIANGAAVSGSFNIGNNSGIARTWNGTIYRTLLFGSVLSSARLQEYAQAARLAA